MSDDRVLTLSLRPRTFSEMVGQSKVTEAVLAQINSGRVPRAWMFEGPPGSGKTTIARIIALSFQLKRADFGNPTPEDWERSMFEGNWRGYDIIELNASEHNGVDDVKSIAQGSRYNPSPGSKKRVFILDEAQRLTRDAQNLLLKYVEDPPPSTVWIICTTDPGKILPALKSRCNAGHYRMRALMSEGISKLVKRAAKAAGCKKSTESLVEALDMGGVTSPRLIVAAVERFNSGASAQAAVTSGDAEIDSLRICRAFIKGDWPSVKAQMQGGLTGDSARAIRLGVLGYLRSILLSSSGGPPPSRLCETILALSGNGPYEDPAYAAWVAAILFQECRKYKS